MLVTEPLGRVQAGAGLPPQGLVWWRGDGEQVLLPVQTTGPGGDLLFSPLFGALRKNLSSQPAAGEAEREAPGWSRKAWDPSPALPLTALDRI